MSFGKRAVRVKKDVSKYSGNAEKSICKSNSIDSRDNNINNNDNTSDIGVKPKKTYSFTKKTGSKSSGLLFGKTKEEKLKLYIYNLKLLHPNMPNFWLDKVIENFKKKFDIK